MIIVRFTGLVHPRAGQWVYDSPLTLKRGGEQLTIIIHDSTFSVTLETADVAGGMEQWSDPQRTEWFNAQWQDTSTWIRAALDTLGFHLGAAIEIELLTGSVDQTVQGAVTYSWIVFNRLNHSEFSTVEGNRVGPERTTKYLKAAVEVPHVRYALADLRSALRYPDDAAFYAYRAVESIRQCFADPNGDQDRAREWEQLRTTLGFTHEELGELAQAARGRRHGATDFLTADDRSRCIMLAREVVTRFVEQLPQPSDSAPSAEA